MQLLQNSTIICNNCSHDEYEVNLALWCVFWLTLYNIKQAIHHYIKQYWKKLTEAVQGATVAALW